MVTDMFAQLCIHPCIRAHLRSLAGAFNKMDPQTTFGLFTWDDDCPGDCHFREVRAWIISCGFRCCH